VSNYSSIRVRETRVFRVVLWKRYEMTRTYISRMGYTPYICEQNNVYNIQYVCGI